MASSARNFAYASRYLLIGALISSLFAFAGDNSLSPFSDPWFIPVVLVLVLETYKIPN